MKQRITIFSKNVIRNLVYKIYRVYKNKLENKIPLYDLQTFDIIKKLPKDATCIDVGVNEGQILRFLNSHCSDGHIIGIEPIPKLAKYLKSKYSRVAIKEMALSDENGESEFYYYPDRKAISSLKERQDYDPDRLRYEKINVRIKKLDEVFDKDRLDFIKIDVEGAEYNVLKGASEILKKFHPVIIFESGIGGLEFYNHTPEDIFELLGSMNYKISTMHSYVNKKKAFSKTEFINNFLNGYDYQYIAY